MISAIAGENALYYYFHVKKKTNYSSLYLTLKIPLQAVYVYNFTFEITLQAIQKTFHNLLLLLSIFDLVREHCHGHDYAHDHEQLTMTGVPCGNSSPLLFTPAQLIRGSEASSHFDSSLCLTRCAHWHGKDIDMCQIYSSPRTTL